MPRILYFGIARDLTGIDAEEIAGVDSVAALWDALLERHPRLAQIRPATRVAVDMTYTSGDAAIADTSEVAIIPPVAGG